MGQETTAPVLVRRRDLRKQEEAARRAERKLPFLRSAVASPAPRTEDLVERRSSGTVGARSIATRGSDGSAVRALKRRRVTTVTAMASVSVAGTAEIVHDRAKMEELYSPSLDIWFEDGLDTPGIALLTVTPVVAEFWEPAKGKVAMAAGALKALVTRDTPDDDIMNHGRVTC